MKTNRLLIFAVAAAATLTAQSQVPDSPAPAPAAPAAQPGGAPAGGQPQQPASSTMFGNEVPVLDPGSEIMTFNGKNWNVNNNRIFQARFEKYLNAPEATSKDDVEYRAYMDRILFLLQPGNITPQNVDAAFKLLPVASRYDIDARLCASLADAVYSVWQAQRNQGRLEMANNTLAEEQKRLEWNLKVANEDKAMPKAPRPPSSGGGRNGGQQQNNGGTTQAIAKGEDYQNASYIRRLTEATAAIKANQVKRELSELQAKVEFQAMMMQFFLQRRFQHVLISTRFYRALFTDGDTKLNLGTDATDLFKKTTGSPPTVSILDSLANEMLRDVREGVKSFSFLLEKGELYSATHRLQESFVTGEYMPEVRLVPRDQKRKCLAFSQKGFELITAIDVKDYDRAEKLCDEMKAMASDFNDTAPRQKVEGTRFQVRMLLGKARDSMLSNDKATMEKCITDATMAWPNWAKHPGFASEFENLLKQGDVVQKTLLEFDQLVSQRNIRQIWADKIRFIAAVATNHERKATLEKIMADMQSIEGALMRAEEMARQSNYAGAWEGLEKSWAQYPDDAILNQRRADMTTRASDFVKTVRSAEELEKKEQFGSSLSHYLKAQKLYPASDFSRDGIDRLVKLVLPED